MVSQKRERIPAFPLINGAYIFEDESQKKEAIYVEGVLSLNKKLLLISVFQLLPFFVMHRMQSHIKKLKKLLVIIDISYVWTVNPLAKVQILKQKRFNP